MKIQIQSKIIKINFKNFMKKEIFFFQESLYAANKTVPSCETPFENNCDT
jgi:hypothetical protein